MGQIPLCPLPAPRLQGHFATAPLSIDALSVDADVHWVLLAAHDRGACYHAHAVTMWEREQVWR
jgi:hypothetical protein